MRITAGVQGGVDCARRPKKGLRGLQSHSMPLTCHSCAPLLLAHPPCCHSPLPRLEADVPGVVRASARQLKEKSIKTRAGGEGRAVPVTELNV